MVSEPRVGDWVEVESDSGEVTNAPWKNKVVDIKDGKFYFDESSVHVGYTLNKDNIKDMIVTKSGDNIWIYKK